MEDIKISKIIRIGSSYGIVIPMPILTQLGFQRGDFLMFGIFEPEVFFARRLNDEQVRMLKPKIVHL